MKPPTEQSDCLTALTYSRMEPLYYELQFCLTLSTLEPVISYHSLAITYVTLAECQYKTAISIIQ